MAIDFLYPQYEVVRNYDRCIACRACERQCANEVHFYDPEFEKMMVDESKCVNCHRCVTLCPANAPSDTRAFTYGFTPAPSRIRSTGTKS